MNDKDNIILFPTNRIKNKESAKKPVDEKQHKLLVEQQTKDFVEGNVDDIAYTLLDKFVNRSALNPLERILSLPVNCCGIE